MDKMNGICQSPQPISISGCKLTLAYNDVQTVLRGIISFINQLNN